MCTDTEKEKNNTWEKTLDGTKISEQVNTTLTIEFTPSVDLSRIRGG